MKKTHNNVTELVFILDRSGSMAPLVSDTIGGFNSTVDRQRKLPGECLITTVLFDTEFIRLHDRTPISRVRPMTEEDYTPGGCTALLDAIGDTIDHVAHIHKYARAEDVPERTIFVITTDGLENASTRFDHARIKRMISLEQEKYGWEFIFMAANIDAAAAAASIGVRRDRAVNYTASSVGTRRMHAAVADAVCELRSHGDLYDDWAQETEEAIN